MNSNTKHTFAAVIILSIVISTTFGSAMGFWAGATMSGTGEIAVWLRENIFKENFSKNLSDNANTQIISIVEESSVIEAVEKVQPAVVNIIVTKDLPIIERYYVNPFGNGFFGIPQYRQQGTEEREIGGGSGFIINSDGYIITNKHVVIDEEAHYTVLMNNGSRHEAEVLARDTINDIAILKIEGGDWPYLELADSAVLRVGQSVIAIGNALGEFRNTVSTGVISGLSRSIQAGSGGAGAEYLTGVIQTDASINPGNSGGPLLNLSGQVIGVNTAIVQSAQNIGFAIPVNDVKNIYESVKKYGRIVRPWLGVRYVGINETIAKQNNLAVDYGVLIVSGETEADLAIIPGSPADKAGLRENDIILELNNKRIDQDNPFAKAISRSRPGDKIKLKILSQGEEKDIEATLDEMR